MACEACRTKFTLFKRKKQCMDCLHYFCADCVIRRFDRVLSCDNCSMLSRRPLIRSQILQMRSRHLRQYLEAKKISIRGCLEKEDLVNLLIRFANGNEAQLNGIQEQYQTIPEHSRSSQRHFNFSSAVPEASSPRRSRSPPTYNSTTTNQPSTFQRVPESSRIPQSTESRETPGENIRVVSSAETTSPNQQSSSPNVRHKQCNCDPTRLVQNFERSVPESTASPNTNILVSSDSTEAERNSRVESSVDFPAQSSEGLEEMVVEASEENETMNASENDTNDVRVEIEELPDSAINANSGPEPVITESDDAFPDVSNVNMETSEIFTEIHTWSETVKLSDIRKSSDFECLTTKQLKYLLLANRVDFKGCVERYELLDRALRLWTEYKKSRKEAENSDMDALCKICLDAPIECVLLECGHMACCIDCGKRMSECPICRQYIIRVVRFFRA